MQNIHEWIQRSLLWLPIHKNMPREIIIKGAVSVTWGGAGGNHEEY